ncbi:MAG: hypothetical protein RI956_170, partial [Pseudomonadota bacterium]
MPTTPSTNISAVASNFLRSIIQHDLNSHTYVDRTWNGKPGLIKTNNFTALDTYSVRLRFPPEPNGYLHIGHAKSICLNFGLAH